MPPPRSTFASSLWVIVAGMFAGDPFHGGATWAALQYVLGLRELGYDVMLIDPLAGSDVDAAVATYFDAVTERFGLEGRAALLPAEGAAYGVSDGDLARFVSQATVLVNLSGRWRDRERFDAIPVRVYVDLDPGFTQVWHEQGADVGMDGHTHHFTVGAGVADAAYVPATPGVTWRATLPPVVLKHWPVCGAPTERNLTTVANWRSYGSMTRDGVQYGQKAHAFRALDTLPQTTDIDMHVALSIDAGDDVDRQRLEACGWLLDDPQTAAGTPDRYQRYVQSSWAEIGVAKSGYVNGRTGWVSDRSACYLASGRPVIAQDTGLDGVLPVGHGLVTFDGVDDGGEAVAEVAGNYDHHAVAARRLAVEHLDATRVLGTLMSEALR